MESAITPRTLDELEQLFAERDLSALFDQLKPHARPSIAIERSEQAAPAPGSSRLGGVPDLPAGQDWFRNTASGEPLNFIGQINLAEVAAVTESALPAEGMLYFFYDLEALEHGVKLEDRHGQKVFYSQVPVAELTQVAAPEGIEMFDPAGLNFVPTIDLPHIESDLVTLDLDGGKYDALLDLNEDVELDNWTKLLGHSVNVQGGMELVSELASSGIDASDGFAAGRASEEARENARQWTLLFQVDSDPDTGMSIGSVEGCLYFWIKAEDLANGNFDNVWQVFQV